MPSLYVCHNNRYISYALEFGGRGDQKLPDNTSDLEAEYAAVMYGLNEYFLKWNKELDSRWSDLDPETHNLMDVIESSARTRRPLPPPVLVCLSNELVFLQLSRQVSIPNPGLTKMAKQVWQMTQNVEVKYMFVPRSSNIAYKGV